MWSIRKHARGVEKKKISVECRKHGRTVIRAEPKKALVTVIHASTRKHVRSMEKKKIYVRHRKNRWAVMWRSIRKHPRSME